MKDLKLCIKLFFILGAVFIINANMMCGGPGCSSMNEVSGGGCGGYRLSVSPAELTFAADATQEKMIIVETDAKEWAYQVVTADWIITRKEGNILYVAVARHADIENARTAVITFTAGDAKNETITVTQRGRPPIAVSPTSLTFTYNATAAQKLTVSINVPNWSVSRPSSATWISYSMNGNELLVSVQPNTGQRERSVDLTFKAGSANPIIVKVIQLAINDGGENIEH